MKKPPTLQYDADGNIIMSEYDRMLAKYGQNTLVTKIFLNSIKALFRVFTLPGIRHIHPWVSEKHTHGVMLPINEELKIDNVPLPYPIIEEFIEKSSHRMIMTVCGCRQAYSCPNHPIELGCINLGESVLDLSPGLGRLASKQEALDHVKKAIDNGLVPYIGKGRIDNTLYGIPDKGKLMGLCFCCHCCCLTDAFNTLSADYFNRLFPRIEEIKFEVTDACTGCGTCLEYCLYKAITIENGVAVQNDMCRQCGRCATYCPTKAITVSMDNSDFKDALIQRISSKVDIT